jgi:hypothetical protein
MSSHESRDRFETLEQDLVANPPRISAYHDLPFAIFHYDPRMEFAVRSRIRLLALSLEQNHRRRVTCISLAELLWRGIKETEGIDSIAKVECELGFDRAQATVETILSDKEFFPLSVELKRRIEKLDPATEIVFLMRAAAFAPAIYQVSKLLDELKGSTNVPSVLFYPGALEGTTGLVFMNIDKREAAGNYRVKIY